MNSLTNVTAHVFTTALQICQEFIPDFPAPIRQTVWSFRGRPKLMMVEDLSKKTIAYFAVRKSAQPDRRRD